jgi:hypothetical protein
MAYADGVSLRMLTFSGFRTSRGYGPGFYQVNKISIPKSERCGLQWPEDATF